MKVNHIHCDVCEEVINISSESKVHIIIMHRINTILIVNIVEINTSAVKGAYTIKDWKLTIFIEVFVEN